MIIVEFLLGAALCVFIAGWIGAQVIRDTVRWEPGTRSVGARRGAGASESGIRERYGKQRRRARDLGAGGRDPIP
jgi:hypothetical protein